MKLKKQPERIKRVWAQPQIIHLNVKKTASGNGNKWETHPHAPTS